MKIGVDFDRVLFRTEDFKQHLEQQIDGFLEKYPEGLYSHEKHAERLGIRPEKIFGLLDCASKFVYEDVGELEQLENHELWIVSRGDPVFQREKIQRSGVIEHFDRVVIVQDESKDVDGIDFLFDDTQSELDRAGVPGFLFDRQKHSMQDVVKKVKQLETRKSV